MLMYDLTFHRESSGPSSHRSKGESKEKDRERGERKDRDGDKVINHQ